MTPKEKAEELINKFLKRTSKHEQLETAGLGAITIAKQCALIAVDEIIKSEPRYPSNVDWDDAGGTFQYYYEAQREEAERYWEDVKQAIEKL